MLYLREFGLQPANIPFILMATLEGLKGNDLVLRNFFYNSVWTSDGGAYPRQGSEFSGRFKVEPDSDLLMGVKDGAQLTGGALSLPSDEAYANLTGPEFIRVKADGKEYALLARKAKVSGGYSVEELYELGATPLWVEVGIAKAGGKEVDEIRNSDLLLALAHYDFGKEPADPDNLAAKQLIDDYYNELFNSALSNNIRGNQNSKTIYFMLSAEQSTPIMRAWEVSCLGCGYTNFQNLEDYVNNYLPLIGIGTQNTPAIYPPEDIKKAMEIVDELRNAENKKVIRRGIAIELEKIIGKL